MMAKMNIYPTDAFKDLWDLDFGGMAEEALTEGSEVLLNTLKKNAQNVIKHDGDSEMVNSIKANKPKKAKNGAYIVNVFPSGYSSSKVYYQKNKTKSNKRKYKVSNALKAIWKEYGIDGHQEAQPFITPSVIETEKQIQDIIQKSFDKRINT